MFIKYQHQNMWWRLDYDRMLAFNYYGGHHNINENSEEYMLGEINRAETWHELYKSTGFIPFETLGDRTTNREAWIAPSGVLIWCTAHEGMAEDIFDVIYGIDDDNIPCFGAGEALVELGWIKVSSYMWNHYLECHQADGYWNMTEAQFNSLKKWCGIMRIPVPTCVRIIKENYKGAY